MNHPRPYSRQLWRTARFRRIIILICSILITTLYIYKHKLHDTASKWKEPVKDREDLYPKPSPAEAKPVGVPSDKFVHIYNEDPSNVVATCVNYAMLPPLEGATKLCVHNRSDDYIVSGTILKGLHWEKQQVASFGKILKAHPNIMFIDVGSHVGMYTMYASRAGNRAIAIDPLKKNLRLLRKSVQLMKQEDNVTILWNAVSNKHENLYLEEGQIGNIGSTHLVAADKVVDRKLQAAPYRIHTILLDDLLQEFDLDNKQVIMKMDMEGSEWKALEGGDEFFKRVNVCYVFMEFYGHKLTANGRKIIDFMASHSMLPYMDLSLKERLPLNDTKDYALDAVFAKHTKDCVKQE